jgi:hypothetical protein
MIGVYFLNVFFYNWGLSSCWGHGMALDGSIACFDVWEVIWTPANEIYECYFDDIQTSFPYVIGSLLVSQFNLLMVKCSAPTKNRRIINIISILQC